MRSLSSLGIGLSLVFGCLFLALLAELYYLLWWKKRISHRDIEDQALKKSSSLSSTPLNPHEICSSVSTTDSHIHEYDNEGSVLRPFGGDRVESEIMSLHNLSGPLFTIKEETKEDLESEDGNSRGGKRSKKGSRSKSFSELLYAVEILFLTPLSSPPFLNSYNHYGNNPLFESSSPPPKLKFLKDAEEKLVKAPPVVSTSMVSNEEDGSFIKMIIGKKKDKDQHHQMLQDLQHCSNSSKVLPLPCSPSTLRQEKETTIFYGSSKE